ncbi:MAG: hypothetical protein ACTHJL_09665, partial [Amnibacterium sp.]
ADGLTAAAVAVVGVVIILAPALSWLDPVAGALIGLLVAVGAVRLLAAVLVAVHRGEAVEVDPD